MHQNHLQIRAIHHHVAQTHCVKNEMESVLAPAYPNILEIPILDVDQNAYQIRIAIAIRLAPTTDAKTLARDHVV